MRLHKITVGCLDGNDASRRVIEKLGVSPHRTRPRRRVSRRPLVGSPSLRANPRRVAMIVVVGWIDPRGRCSRRWRCFTSTRAAGRHPPEEPRRCPRSPASTRSRRGGPRPWPWPVCSSAAALVTLRIHLWMLPVPSSIPVVGTGVWARSSGAGGGGLPTGRPVQAGARDALCSLRQPALHAALSRARRRGVFA